jgi:hypothetical protein
MDQALVPSSDSLLAHVYTDQSPAIHILRRGCSSGLHVSPDPTSTAHKTIKCGNVIASHSTASSLKGNAFTSYSVQSKSRTILLQLSWRYRSIVCSSVSWPRKLLHNSAERLIKIDSLVFARHTGRSQKAESTIKNRWSKCRKCKVVSKNTDFFTNPLEIYSSAPDDNLSKQEFLPIYNNPNERHVAPRHASRKELSPNSSPLHHFLHHV